MLKILKNKHLLTEEKVQLFDKEKEYFDLNILKEILIKDKLQGNIILYGIIDGDKNKIYTLFENKIYEPYVYEQKKLDITATIHNK